MRFKIVTVLLAFLLALSAGCATTEPIPLDQKFWQGKGKKVGVALGEFPHAEVDVYSPPSPPMTSDNKFSRFDNTFMAPPGYTEQPLRTAETMPLRNAAKELTGKEFEKVQDIFSHDLKGKGFIAFKVDNRINMSSLPKFKDRSHDTAYASKDFRDLGKSTNADYLIIVWLRHYGAICRYMDVYNYGTDIYAEVQAEMIDTATNQILWRTGGSQGNFTKELKASCAQSDGIPIILNELGTLLTTAAEKTAAEFFVQAP
jgi:hypothetical protein